MAKASIGLPNGTSIQIEGTPEEISQLLAFYAGQSSTVKAKTRRKSTSVRKIAVDTQVDGPDLSAIVNLARTCDEAELIESRILDSANTVNRVLLPLYVVHEHMENTHGLTSGDIHKVTKELGIPVSVSNASTSLSGGASKFVMGDKVRTAGRPVRYKLNRRGMAHFASVLKDGDKQLASE